MKNSYKGVELTYTPGWQSHFGNHSDDEEDQGACSYCVYIEDNSSDIFGECKTCLNDDATMEEEWLYTNEEGRCPHWKKCPVELRWCGIENFNKIKDLL